MDRVDFFASNCLDDPSACSTLRLQVADARHVVDDLGHLHGLTCAFVVFRAFEHSLVTWAHSHAAGPKEAGFSVEKRSRHLHPSEKM